MKVFLFGLAMLFLALGVNKERQMADELAAEREKGAKYAAALAACANGDDFYIGNARVRCKGAKQ